MSHKKLSPFIVKVSVLGYFPLHEDIGELANSDRHIPRHLYIMIVIINSMS